MSAEAIAALAAQDIVSSAMPEASRMLVAGSGPSPMPLEGLRTAGTGDPVSGTFDALVDGLEALNERMTASRAANQGVVMGDLDNLHHVMLNAEQARLQFELALQVRNKLLEAYQDLMRQQI
jgi:flagellar hook-basal body complex protein FliE